MKRMVNKADVLALKPTMVTATTASMGALCSPTCVATVKMDGEFNVVRFRRGEPTYTCNRFGRTTTSLPAVGELEARLSATRVNDVTLLAELYAVDADGNPLGLPHFIHALKGGDTRLWQRIRLGVFDIVAIDGTPCTLTYEAKLRLADEWLAGGRFVGTPTRVNADSPTHLHRFWTQQVEQRRWEGVVMRVNGSIYKVKPKAEVDVAVIGINKQNKGFAEQKARSLKMALMNPDGSFVEIGDFSGVSDDESIQLWALMGNRVGEDGQTVFVAPTIVATVEHTYPPFHQTANRVFRFQPFREVGTQTAIRLKNAHVVKWRVDKRVCVSDVGVAQGCSV